MSFLSNAQSNIIDINNNGKVKKTIAEEGHRSDAMQLPKSSIKIGPTCM